MRSEDARSCQICRAERVNEIVWLPGGPLAIGLACGTIQKLANAKWRDETARTYRDYEIYHRSGALEQAVFDAGSGAA